MQGIIEEHDGEISLMPTNAHGAEFNIVMPLDVTEMDKHGKKKPPLWLNFDINQIQVYCMEGVSPKRVFLVDDEEMILQILIDRKQNEKNL
jgi:hypothetical protein